MAYVTYEEYKKLHGKTLTEENADWYLEYASLNIDSLTYNRIVKIGYDNLTEFQKSRVQMAVCTQADFLAENESWLNSGVSQYSINGVSISYTGNDTLLKIGDTLCTHITYSYIKQTGLCVGLVRC